MKRNRYIIFIFLLIGIFSLFSCKKEEENKKDPVLTSIELSSDSVINGTKEEILNGLYIVELYDNNTKSLVKVTEQMITSGKELLDTPGTHELTITHKAKELKVKLTIKETLEVVSLVLSEDSILDSTDDTFPLDNLLVEVTYNNGKTEVLEVTPDLVIEGKELLSVIGTHDIVIKILNKTLTIQIELKEKIKLSEISVNEQSKLEFEQGKFDPSQIFLNALYTDGSKRIIVVTTKMIKDAELLNEVGTHIVTLAYNNLTVDVTIIISAPFDFSAYSFSFDSQNGGYELTSYSGLDEILIIPELYNDLPIISIGMNAFYGNETLKKVVIPKTVKRIEKGAFYVISTLSSIIIPSSVEYIGEHAFQPKDSEKKVFYLESSSIPSAWASSWYNLQHSYIHFNTNPQTITQSGDYEYYLKENSLVLSNYYGNEQNLTIPSKIDGYSVDVIGGACFKQNLNLTSIVLPDTVKLIETYGISECSNLTDITLSNSLTTLGDYALRGCVKLEHIKLPSSLKVIGKNAFNMCSELKEMIIPEGVETVGSYAFAWCVKLTMIYLPMSLVNLQVGACYACSSATIYTPRDAEASTWESGWNMSSRPIKFNYTL